ncbi:copper-translocating P-type ATPase [Tabrizicola sp. DMG-N-6]|uniref:Copper-translocating P-type ATPase n=2 Tax=Szabonella alba TaxID=2804194 RepID=A0A8K0V891_9RHOB|nr:copper-translocating P-type ATPase [Szabonella alba]
MSCAACVGRVERVLSAVDGAGQARVNLAAGRASVKGGAATDLAAALSRAGFTAREDHLRLSVTGMDCASCIGRVEAALTALPGVTEARVNLAAGTADVRFLAGSLTVNTLISAISGIGYVANLQEKSASTPDASLPLRRDFWLAALLALPVFLSEMGGHVVPALHHGLHGVIGQQGLWILQFLLTTLLLIGPGRQFFIRGWAALRHAAPDMNALVMIGTGAAWIYSSIATFAPALLPAASRAVYFESAAVIVTLILLGRWMEARAKGQSGAAIARLVGLQPRQALVETDGGTEERPIAALHPGDILHLRPGERVAVDGAVIDGNSWLDEAMLTGEPQPVAKGPGDAVTGGTVNGTGALRYRAMRVGQDTVLAQIIRLVADAQGARLPVQDLVNRITGWFVPAVLAVALATVGLWLLFGPEPRLTHALVAGVAVLIVACPCAMGLAVPVSIMVGTGRAAELGVLFRRGDALQALQGIGILALDKTGTLTAGQPELTDIALAGGEDEPAILAAIAAIEARSEHPLARAICRAANARGLDLPAVTAFTALPGHGVSAEIAGARWIIGADRLMRAEGVETAPLSDRADGWAAEGRSPVYAARDGRIVAALAVADPVKPGTPEALARLRALGLRLVMVTGDNRAAAAAIAARLGLDEVRAEILPEGKVAVLAELMQQGRTGFVGDGINDAPALARADVGIAIGTGTDVAMESADVVLVSGDLRGVVAALEISRATMRNIRQNLFWAFGYNIALIPVAVGLFYPAFGMQLSPMLAAGAMAASSLLVLGNALRLRFAGGRA